MEPSLANTGKTMNDNADSLGSDKKQVTAMKNTRLSLSDSQLKWEIIFKRILITMSVILVLIIIGVLITLIKGSWPLIK